MGLNSSVTDYSDIKEKIEDTNFAETKRPPKIPLIVHEKELLPDFQWLS